MTVTKREPSPRARSMPGSRAARIEHANVKAPRPPHSINREDLLRRLHVANDGGLILVTAPAGYGKTTLLGQWVRMLNGPVAWLTAERADSNPETLLAHLADALRIGGLSTAERIDRDALSTKGQPVESSVRDLTTDLNTGGVLIIDRVELIRSKSARQVLLALLTNLDERLRLVISSRTDPRLPVSTLRAQGRLLELREEDLAMSSAEARALLVSNGVNPREHLDHLLEVTEGWPVMLQLMAAAIKRRVSPEESDLRFVEAFIDDEIMAHLSPRQSALLTQTSLFDWFDPALCDAVVEGEHSRRLLEELHNDRLIVDIDHSGRWRIASGVLRQHLRGELERSDPSITEGLHRRGAEFFEKNGMTDLAIRHSAGAGDWDRFARLMGQVMRERFAVGDLAKVFEWMTTLETAGLLHRYPEITAAGALAHVLAGNALHAQHWLETAACYMSGEEEGESLVSLVAALSGRHGVSRMKEEAIRARAVLPTGSRWLPATHLAEGLARLWSGEDETADAHFAEAICLGEDAESNITVALALAEQAVIAIRNGDWQKGHELSSRAIGLIHKWGLNGLTTSALPFVVAARCARHRHEITEARDHMETASALGGRMNSSMRGLAVQTYIEMARTNLELSDLESARSALRSASNLLTVGSDLGLLNEQLDEVRAHLEALPRPAASIRLTNAELRVLPYLTTHLSIPEIAENLYVSRHTVKTQAISIYQKLGVSTRSEAVTAASRVGLIGLNSEGSNGNGAGAPRADSA